MEISTFNFAFTLFLSVNFIFSINAVEISKCDGAKTCYDCMGISPECHWCFDDELYDDTRAENGPGYRCGLKDTLIKRGCSSDKIQYVESVDSSFGTNIFNKLKYFSDNPSTETQLRPKSKSLKVRPGTPFSTYFEFQSLRDYPVDLYFLVDVSYTMRPHIATVSNMTMEIKDEMLKVTNDLRIGFGAFVDKPIFPFVDPGRISNPCYGDSLVDVICEPTFLFRHMLTLTDEFSEFRKHSGNLDTPEGGFDALLQVAHCPDRIGWRTAARKIVVFATDGTFHLAGDGRLAGLINPPPTTCQLSLESSTIDTSKKYWMWNKVETDYPSIGEVVSSFFSHFVTKVARVLTNTSISVIFATVESLAYVYKSAASLLPSADVGIFTGNADNIVELLRENYKKIASKVTLQFTFNKDVLNVKVLTKCSGEKNFTEKNFCDNHPVGGKIDYKLEISPLVCFSGSELVNLKIIGLDEEASIIVESQCNCPLCDETNWPMVYSERCNGQGSLECGSCKCSQGFTGDFCQCSDKEDQVKLEKQCRLSETDPPCSRRGRCSCGKCVCSKERYQGKYCECDREICPRASDNYKVCGGEERGTCECDGRCKCKPGYMGDTCDCLESHEQCYDPNNTTFACSNHGFCDCGSCFCEAGWTGRLCNDPQGNGERTCHMSGVQTCIPCLLAHHLIIDDKKGLKPKHDVKIHKEAALTCEAPCNSTDFDYHNAFIVMSNEKNQNQNLCILYVEDCNIYFLYRFSDVISRNRKVNVRIIRDKDCRNPHSIIYVVVAVILAIVLGGLLFLFIYKVVITIEDHKESAALEKLHQRSQWGITVNPTFHSPSTTVVNPLYRKNGHL